MGLSQLQQEKQAQVTHLKTVFSCFSGLSNGLPDVTHFLKTEYYTEQSLSHHTPISNSLQMGP
jgi:hypothetical protein